MPKLKKTSERADDAPREFIESLDRGLRVLQAFSAGGRAMTLSDVARIAALPRATARRILITLQQTGFVASDDRLFSLTPRVLTLASAYLASNQISAVMQPLMDEVSARAKEVCSLAILDGDEAVFIARSSPARVFSAGIDIGYRLPLFCTSVGRILLGRLSDLELNKYLKAAKLTRHTADTIVDKSAVAARITADRGHGYSLVDGEAEHGFRSIAVAIRRYDGAVVAAANIGAHVDRITCEEMTERFLPLLRDLAAKARPLLI